MNTQQTIDQRYMEYLEAAKEFGELMAEKKYIMEQYSWEPSYMKRLQEIERIEPEYMRVMRDARYRWGLAGKPTTEEKPMPRPRMELPPAPANRIVSEWDNSITRRYS